MKKSFTSFLLTFSILMIGMNTSGQGFFGIASGGETMGTHATLYPMLHDAGVTTVRAWPEWKGIEPSNDVWDWTACDSLVASAKANHIELTGVFAYLPAWVSASGQERTFPIADIEYYRDYVRTMLTRYKDDVKYWEVYNEFNSPTFNRNGTIEDYVQMTQEAYIIAKQIDPGLKIGISCADVDASFFSNVLSQGASGYVDFIAVHPYSMMSATMDGRETPFLQLGATLREMLVANGEPANLPILITEIGVPSTNDPAREEEQAKGLIKAYILPLAQDVEKVDWFEGRGPDYGNGDFGIIRNDWTIRPSYTALQTMTGLMGATPHYLGWLNPTGSSYCFVFQGATDKVMVSWATDDVQGRGFHPYC